MFGASCELASVMEFGLNRRAPVGRQVKDDNGEEGDGDAWYDEVDGVEERLAADRHVERDVRLRREAVVEALDVLAGRHVQDVPLDAAVELLEVDAVLDHVRHARRARLLVNVRQVNLESSTHVAPRIKLGMDTSHYPCSRAVFTLPVFTLPEDMVGVYRD